MVYNQWNNTIIAGRYKNSLAHISAKLDVQPHKRNFDQPRIGDLYTIENLKIIKINIIGRIIALYGSKTSTIYMENPNPSLDSEIFGREITSFETKIYNIQTSQSVKIFDGEVYDIEFSSDGKKIAQTPKYSNRAVCIKDIESDTFTADLHESDVSVYSISSMPSESVDVFVLGCSDGSVRLWDTRTEKSQRNFYLFNKIRKVLVHPHGKDIAVNSGNTITLYSLVNEQAQTIYETDHDINTMAFDENGENIAISMPHRIDILAQEDNIAHCSEY